MLFPYSFLFLIPIIKIIIKIKKKKRVVTRNRALKHTISKKEVDGDSRPIDKSAPKLWQSAVASYLGVTQPPDLPTSILRIVWKHCVTPAGERPTSGTATVESPETLGLSATLKSRPKHFDYHCSSHRRGRIHGIVKIFVSCTTDTFALRVPKFCDLFVFRKSCLMDAHGWLAGWLSRGCI